MTDTEILDALISKLDWDGYGYWLPDLCIKSREQCSDFTPAPSNVEIREALIALLKNKS